MFHEVIDIQIDYKKMGIVHEGPAATMTAYIREQYPAYQNVFQRPLVIICPGGGYEHHSPREGEAVALKMLDFGYNALVLRYSLLPNTFPCALYEAAYAVNYARKHAEVWDIHPNKIIMAGFSAGAHVAASLGTMWHDAELLDFVEKELNAEPQDIRPDALLLGYPVLTSGEFAHRKSFERLLGTARYEKLLDTVSLEKRVTEDTPKTFLWHTFSDGSVPVENSLLFAGALREKNIPFELHIYPAGNHGLGLGTKETDTIDGTHFQPEVASWTGLFQTWVENNI